MTHAEVRAAVAGGERAADVARRSGLPITAVHHIVNGRGPGIRGIVKAVCALCKGPAESRGGPSHICHHCRPAHRKAATAALNVVKKAVNIRMLPPAKDRVCVDCGDAAFHYDHRDYSKPLAVEPVCRSCNILRGPAKAA